jgi:hypothetical protein
MSRPEELFQPFFSALREALIIVRDPEHHLLGYFVLHIVGKGAHLLGAFAPVRRIVSEGRHKSPLKRPPQVARASPPSARRRGAAAAPVGRCYRSTQVTVKGWRPKHVALHGGWWGTNLTVFFESDFVIGRLRLLIFLI